MIFVLYGPDTFRARQKLKDVIANYRTKNETGVNFHHLDQENFDLGNFKAIFKSGTMFQEKRLVVLDQTLNLKKPELEEWFGFVKAAGVAEDKNSFLIILEVKLPAGKIGKFLAKNPVKTQEFGKLEGQALGRWVAEEFQKAGASASQAGVGRLVDFFGNDTWRLAQEIKKLASYKNSITDKEVEQVSRSLLEPDIFKAIDALGQKNKQEALRIFHEHLALGQSPSYLLTMIAYQFRNIASVKTGRKVKMHPFVLMKTRAMAQKFDLAEIKKIYSLIFETDLAIKSGRAEPDVALDILINSI
jgi:DNA polymerase-3 subunit delta